MNKHFPEEQDFKYLTLLFALIFHEDFYASPENISRVLNIPIGQIRQDFVALLSIPKIAETFYATLEEQDLDISFDFPEKGDKEKFQIQMLTGSFDQFRFYSSLDQYFEVPFWLNHMEFVHLREQYPALFSQKTDMLIKSPTPVIQKNDKIIEHIKKLNEAITGHHFVSVFSFYSKNGSDNQSSMNKSTRITFYPKYFYEDTDKNFCYCIGLKIENGQDPVCVYLRLDRISRILKDTSTISLPDEARQKIEEVYQKLDYMWGLCNLDEPVSVKVRIIDNTGNILSKIKAETSLRKYGKLTKDEHGYLYTDTVIGTDNFRSWLRGYGSSVVILEPQELADKMKESALNVIKLYTGTESDPDN